MNSSYDKNVLFSKLKEAILQYYARLEAGAFNSQVRIPLVKDPADQTRRIPSSFKRYACINDVGSPIIIDHVDEDISKQFRMIVRVNPNIAPIGDPSGAVDCMYCISIDIVAPYSGVVFQGAYFGRDLTFDESKGADMQESIPSWIRPSISIDLHRITDFNNVIVLDEFAQKLILTVLCDFDVRLALHKSRDIAAPSNMPQEFAFNRIHLS